MIAQFFRTGQSRASKPSQLPTLRTHDRKWFGDCEVCRSVFVYQERIFIGPIDKPVGGFCYRCRKDYCSSHVNWVKTTIKKPNSEEVYDGHNALCPQCGILLNSHQPELEAIDVQLKTDLFKGINHLAHLLRLLDQREMEQNEIARLEAIRSNLVKTWMAQVLNPGNPKT